MTCMQRRIRIRGGMRIVYGSPFEGVDTHFSPKIQRVLFSCSAWYKSLSIRANIKISLQFQSKRLSFNMEWIIYTSTWYVMLLIIGLIFP